MQPSSHQIERLVSLAALVTAGLGLALTIAVPFVWAFVALLLVTVCLGTDQVLGRGGNGRASLSSLALPALIVLAGALFLRLPVFSAGPAVAGGLIVAGVSLYVALWAEYQTMDPTNPRYQRARRISTNIAYVMTFALYSAIFAPKFRSVLSATAVLLVTVLIGAVLLRGARRPETHPIWIGVVAFILAQTTWALNYWVLGALAGGAILFLVFYTVTGLVRIHLNGRLVPRLLAEHLAVAAAGFAAVVMGGQWLH